jgi:hypothetical protein
MWRIGSIRPMPASDERKRRKYPKRHSLPMPQCPKYTNAGNPCPTRCQVVEIRGKFYKLETCVMHAPEVIRKELGIIGGARPGSGRKRKVHPLDILRQRFEAEAERYFEPFEQALSAMKAVVVGNGASAHIEMVEDVALRLAAVEKLMDRIYGRPKQISEITGADGGALEVNVPNDEERKKQLAAVLASTGALGPVIPQNASASAPTTN